jgi:hypothetical protein
MYVKRNGNVIIVEIKNTHNANSHSEDHLRFVKQLHEQSVVIFRQIPQYLLFLFAEHRRKTLLALEYKFIVEYFVLKARKGVVTHELSGITIDGSTASFLELMEHLW